MTISNDFQNKPVLICIPGLLGGAEDFQYIIEPLKIHFQIEIFDPNKKRRVFGLSGLTQEIMQDISYDTTADDILTLADSLNVDSVFLCGVSLGGKIVYDFAIKYPHRFRGALITDVGPGSFGDSQLFQFVESTISNLNLDQPWANLKEDLRRIIPERNLRSLIQSQIQYPQKTPPAKWKMGMRHFEEMLQRQTIDQQWDSLDNVSIQLQNEKKWIHLLKSETYSAISEKDFEKMKTFKCFQIHYIPDSSHFLHITHKEEIRNSLLKLLTEKETIPSLNK